MKKIGITGGIGSGKTTVAKIFNSFGYEVYFADERAKQLMTQSKVIKDGVTGLFGPEAYLSDGSLNRALIGGIVFQDQSKLNQLNAIVHPETGRDFYRWLDELKKKGYEKSFALKEAAILYESGAYLATDGVIAVYAPKSVRLERVMKRDGADAKAVLDRMNKQWPESAKMQKADHVIYNDGRHSLIDQVRSAIAFFQTD